VKSDADDLWVLVVKTIPGSTAPAVRVRQALKRLLRCLGLRCVRIGGPHLLRSDVAADLVVKPAAEGATGK
jgi:hypothetical protein